MGSNGSSQMAKPPIHIVNLEELLFTFVKRKILKRRKRERLCLGLTMYLEVLERTDSCDASEIVTASIVKMSLSSYSAVGSVALLVSSPLLLKLHCGITYGSKNTLITHNSGRLRVYQLNYFDLNLFNWQNLESHYAGWLELRGFYS